MQHPGAEGVGNPARQRLHRCARAFRGRLRLQVAAALMLALGIAMGISFALGAFALGGDGAGPDTSSVPGDTLAVTNATGAVAPTSVSSDLSRAQAIALIQGRYRARVVRSSEMQDKSGHRLYVFRLLSRGGKVWTVRIDAHTGAEVP